MILTNTLYTCTVFSNTVGIQLKTVGPFFLLCQCVRSSVSMFVMTKLALNVKATSYQRYQHRIQVEAASQWTHDVGSTLKLG